jgi:hypothetical protein
MVNWREDVEFGYVLFMLVSGIVVFFVLYDRTSIELSGAGVVALVLIEGLIGFVAFETDWAINRWDKLGKKLSK